MKFSKKLPHNCVNVIIFVSLSNLTHFFSSEDINECERYNGTCEHKCHNTNGSYSCSCNPGYGLSVNGHSCAGMFTYFTCL